MIKRWMTRWSKVLAHAALASAFVVSFGAFTEAWAICNNKCTTGYHACQDWCTAHNKTFNSQLKCSIRCDDYWLSGKNPQSISVPPHPSNPPDKGVGPGKLKNPPTTVSNPNTPPPPPFQIRSRGRR